MATIDDFGGSGESLGATPLGGPTGWAKAVRDQLLVLAAAVTPAGGATGQLLAKTTATNYDTQWIDPPEGTSGLVTISPQTDSYTLALTDAGTLVEMGKATAQNLTVPLNATAAFPIGTQIDILQTGAGQVTVVAAGGVTVNAEIGLKITGQWAAATLIKRATDAWVLIGALEA